jgi:GxxExxY protein
VAVLHVRTTLSPEIEALLRRIIGCAFAVHSELGPGFLEMVYHRALCLELGCVGLKVESEKSVPIEYRGQVLAVHRIDLVVERQVVVEVKSAERIDEAHVAQLLSYLRAARLRAGLVLNFRVTHLREGIRRVVL